MTKIITIECPSCKGLGRGSLGVCMWCEGSKRLGKSDALRWATQSIVLGSGGYIAGDHDWNDRCEMMNAGNAVRKKFGLDAIN